MELLNSFVAWFQTNWGSVAVAVWSIDQALKIIAKLTPWGWDDNVADFIGNLIAKIFPKKE